MAKTTAIIVIILLFVGLAIIYSLFATGFLTSISNSIFGYLSTNRESLIPNLISEGIGIIITVLIIERIIQWRGEQRWKNARKLIRRHVAEKAKSILDGCGAILKKIDSSAPTENVSRLGVLPLDKNRKILRNQLGNPMGSNLTDYLDTTFPWRINYTEKMLTEYLKWEVAWRLAKECTVELDQLNSTVQDLFNFTGKIQTIVEPPVYEAILLFLDNFEKLKDISKPEIDKDSELVLRRRLGQMVVFGIRFNYYILKGKYPRSHAFAPVSPYFIRGERLRVKLQIILQLPFFLLIDLQEYIKEKRLRKQVPE